jgi:hypothetical protein
MILQFAIARKSYFTPGISDLRAQVRFADPRPKAAIAASSAAVWVGMKALLLAFLAGSASAQLPDVHDMMRKVAFNQAKTQDARTEFVYHQKQNVRVRRANGKVAREEFRDYDITPAPRGLHRELVAVQGRYEKNGDYVAYHEPQKEAVGIDAGLIEGFSEDLRADDSRDGLDAGLFPLTYHQQLKYQFRLVGAETYRGRRVYRVAFQPRDRFDWKGEALIDADEFQPVFVSTKLGRGIPLPVKTLLGTDVKGLGFSVAYQKFADGVWFPVSYGGEFDLHVLFFYKRTISISMTNTDFRRVDVNSQVSYASDTQ